ncbi:MAG TPA: glycosyltransferase family 87 protein [Terriglobales bacterium]|nr:glycosyltransferase family 87 protein [Terriglobales bacterium]
MRLGISDKPLWLFLASVLCAAGVWLYGYRVLIPRQISDAAAHGTPRGNLSDLYPRWLGARELLLHGRDPYSAEVTREIQAGYYGRPLDPSRPADPIDQQAFAYPAYVVFYFAPTVHLGFGIVQRTFFWVLMGITAVSVPLWLRLLGWKVAPSVQAAMMALTLGSLPVLQGLKLQQLTLLVAAMCAAAMALLAAGRPIAAGILLSLATIKPQLLLPLLLWLGVWSLGDLRRRYRWAASFVIVTVFLCAVSEWFLPHWIGRFWHAIEAYRQYAQAIPMLEAILPHPWGRVVEVMFAAMTAVLCIKQRKPQEDTAVFQASTCLVMALAVLTVPKFALYNQVLLLPAILLIARDRRMIWGLNLVSRALLIVVSVLLVWPWFWCTALAALSFLLPQERVERAWAAPFWTVPQIPLGVVALMLVRHYQEMFAASAGPGGWDRPQ